jgi:hypothetical protein
VAAQELYQQLRPGAFGIAYRMLGSVSEAEAIDEDRIQSIRSLVNPDKLAHLGPVSGLTAMLENARRATPGT